MPAPPPVPNDGPAAARGPAATGQPSARLGPWGATALVMGNMIGSGVYLLPASLAPYGWNAVAAWGLTIAGSLLLVGVLNALVRALPGASGPVELIARALGGRAGAITAGLVGWSYWVSIWTANATIAIAAVSYAGQFAPALTATPGTTALAAGACLWAAALVNLSGARAAGGVQLVSLVLKLVPLVVVALVAAMLIGAHGPGMLAPFPAEGLRPAQVGAAATLTLWAMLGFESAAAAADKVADPARTIPRATLLGTAATGILYLFVCSAIALMLPAGVAAGSDAPFADFLRPWAGERAALLVAGAAVVAALGALNGWTLLAGEVPLALARAGRLPAWFGATDARGTPRRAILLGTALASLLLALTAARTTAGLFAAMALLSTAATLWLYLACAIGALAARVAPWLAAPAMLYAIGTLFGAGVEAVAASLVLMAAGVPLLWWAGRGPRSAVGPLAG